METLLLSYEKKEEKGKDFRQDLREGKNSRGITPVQELFLRLFASGISKKEACVQLNMSEDWAYNLLISAKGQEYLTSLQSVLDLEFQGLYQKVIDCIETGLGHMEPQVYLSAASLWLKTSKNKVKLEVSAEDLVKQLMDGKNDST